MITDIVHESICKLSTLQNFSLASNFFNSEAALCMPSEKARINLDDRDNCLDALRLAQKKTLQCARVLARLC
jgi:hypothetical protein